MQAETKQPLSKRQQREIQRENRKRKRDEAKRKQEEAENMPPAPREEFVKPEVRHADDVVIPGLSGRGAVLRVDNLKKLADAGRLTGIQKSAGENILCIVGAYYMKTSPFARESEMARRVGGEADPIRLYVKGRRRYVPTQRPKHPSGVRAHNDGWTGAKLDEMQSFSRLVGFMDRLTRDQRAAVCLMIIDPSRPYWQPLSVAAAVRRVFGYRNDRAERKLVGWLAEALDEADRTLPVHRDYLEENAKPPIQQAA